MSRPVREVAPRDDCPRCLALLAGKASPGWPLPHDSHITAPSGPAGILCPVPPTCPNCGQFQYQTEPDCFNECRRRGIVP